MIFVTVGTSSLGHDDLIKSVDNIAPSLADSVTMQIGNGKYKPVNCEYFKFAPSLYPYYEKANIVISSGGVGTLFELMSSNKKIIGVSNLKMPNRHQNEILGKLSSEGHIIWCKDLGKLIEYIPRIQVSELKPYQIKPCQIHNAILSYLDDQIAI